MAWTAPMTAVASTAFTAAQFNTYVRDNLNETAPAKATTAGQHFVSTGSHAIAARQQSGFWLGTAESTSSSSYGDLTTVGPQVTVTTGVGALLILSGHLSNSSAGQAALMAFAVSGATTIAATDDSCLEVALPATYGIQAGFVTFVTLTPGSNVFTAKYRAALGTATFSNRELIVIPW